MTLAPGDFHPEMRPRGALHRCYLLIEEGLGFPVLAVRGARSGAVLVVSAGVHGDEFEGMRAILEEVESLLEGLKVDLVPNVDRLMIVPEGVTKLSGTMSLLDRLDLDPWAFAAIGDGENDYELLAHARVSGAPRNAVPRLREMATFRNSGPKTGAWSRNQCHCRMPGFVRM